MSSGIQPGEALTEQFHIQAVIFKIDTVQVCDLQLSADPWRQAFCVFYNLVVIKIQAGNTVVAFWVLQVFPL